MTTAPMEPDPPDKETIPAADPGPGAPDPEPGYGVGSDDEEPEDVTES